MSLLLKVTGSVSLVKALFYFKDIITIILFIMAISPLRQRKSVMILYLLYYLLVIIQTLRSLSDSSTNIISTASSVRGLILMPVLITIGYQAPNNEKNIESVKKYYKFLVALAIMAIVEYIYNYFFGMGNVWIKILELDKFHADIKGQPDYLFNGVPWNWYTGSTAHDQVRLIGIWAAPLTAAFVLLLPTVYYSILTFNKYNNRKNNNSKRYFLICTLALILTFTRQIILTFFVALLYIIIHFNRRNKRVIIVSFLILVPIAIVVMLPYLYNYIYNGSTIVHISQIYNSISTLKFLGSGVGTYGTRFSGVIATESQYITVTGQLGFIGLILFLMIFIIPLVDIAKKVNHGSRSENLIAFGILISGIIYLISGISSETISAFTSIAQYYIILGMVWKNCEKM